MGGHLSREDIEELYQDKNINIDNDILYKCIKTTYILYSGIVITFFGYAVYNTLII